jgi:hypothetical protein
VPTFGLRLHQYWTNFDQSHPPERSDSGFLIGEWNYLDWFLLIQRPGCSPQRAFFAPSIPSSSFSSEISVWVERTQFPSGYWSTLTRIDRRFPHVRVVETIKTAIQFEHILMHFWWKYVGLTWLYAELMNAGYSLVKTWDIIKPWPESVGNMVGFWKISLSRVDQRETNQISSKRAPLPVRSVQLSAVWVIIGCEKSRIGDSWLSQGCPRKSVQAHDFGSRFSLWTRDFLHIPFGLRIFSWGPQTDNVHLLKFSWFISLFSRHPTWKSHNSRRSLAVCQIQFLQSA